MNEAVTREEMAAFFDAVHHAKMAAVPGEFPATEAPRKIVLHYNRTNMAAVETTGYFVFNDVKVFIEGAREAAEKRDALTSSQAVFGGPG